jgi:hypothetical protein
VYLNIGVCEGVPGAKGFAGCRLQGLDEVDFFGHGWLI